MRSAFLPHSTRLPRCRAAATVLITAAAVVAAVAAAGCAPANHAAANPNAGQPATPTRSAEPAASAIGSQPPLRAGQVGTLGQVPWSQIGPGWALAEYTAGTNQVAAPVTLYVLDPEGGMYQVYQWPATTDPWTLIDWSGDKTRVLLNDPAVYPPPLDQLTLATGQITTINLPVAGAQVLGYTRPDGENILVAQNGILRYNLSGVLQARLGEVYPNGYDEAVSSADGLTEVVSGGPGVELVSNAGSLIRSLPVPGASVDACEPVRWWNSADVLVSCIPSQVPAMQLWLVPVSGAAPARLTLTHAADGPDQGDLDAWQFPTGLYLQASTGCGPPFIGQQSAGGGVQMVSVGGNSTDNIVVATSGSQMLVEHGGGCEASGRSLVWFNPVTGSVQQVLTEQPTGYGVVSAIAFNGNGEQPP
jgi:hypothetical protein